MLGMATIPGKADNLGAILTKIPYKEEHYE
jgi:hypothetical protein